MAIVEEVPDTEYYRFLSYITTEENSRRQGHARALVEYITGICPRFVFEQQHPDSSTAAANCASFWASLGAYYIGSVVAPAFGPDNEALEPDQITAENVRRFDLMGIGFSGRELGEPQWLNDYYNMMPETYGASTEFANRLRNCGL
jgi:hypothetical protein